MQTSGLSYKGAPIEQWQGLNGAKAMPTDKPTSPFHGEEPPESLEKLQAQLWKYQNRAKAVQEKMKASSSNPTVQEYQELMRLKKEHKNLEQHAQKVSNKISMMEKHTRRFLKNIHYYYNRAQEIEKQKQIIEQRKQEKQAITQKRWRMQQESPTTKLRMKEDATNAQLAQLLATKSSFANMEGKKPVHLRLTVIKMKLEEEKMRKASELKAQKIENERRYKELKEGLIRSNQIRKCEVAKSESLAVLRLDSYQKEKKMKALERLRQEKTKEKFIIRTYEKNLEKLVQTHHQCLEKLKSKDAEEMLAIEKYKKVLDLQDLDLDGLNDGKTDENLGNEEGSNPNNPEGAASMSEDGNQSVQ